MVILTAVVALLAAALHGLIFYMESVDWEGPLARKTFGGTADEARPHAFYAFQQGFYNLFLGLQAAAGAVALLAGMATVGATLIAAGCGAMLGAAVVLFCSSATHRVAACKQGFLPLLALVLLGATLL